MCSVLYVPRILPSTPVCFQPNIGTQIALAILSKSKIKLIAVKLGKGLVWIWGLGRDRREVIESGKENKSTRCPYMKLSSNKVNQ